MNESEETDMAKDDTYTSHRSLSEWLDISPGLLSEVGPYEMRYWNQITKVSTQDMAGWSLDYSSSAIPTWPLEQQEGPYPDTLSKLLSPPDRGATQGRKQVPQRDVFFSKGRFRGVVKLFVGYKEEYSTFLTGFLIDEKTVVTAAHGIYHREYGPCDRVEVVAGSTYQNRGFELPRRGRLPSETRFARHIVVHWNYYFDRRRLHDLAFIELSEPFSKDVIPLSYIQTPLVAEDVRLRLLGYPCDLPGRDTHYVRKGTVMYSVEDRASYKLEVGVRDELRHNLFSEEGNSGGPVLQLINAETDEWVVVGVHSFTELFDFTDGCPEGAVAIDRFSNDFKVHLDGLARLAGRTSKGVKDRWRIKQKHQQTVWRLRMPISEGTVTVNHWMKYGRSPVPADANEIKWEDY